MGCSVRIAFGSFGCDTSRVRKLTPNLTAASDSKQPQLSIAHLASKKLQHRHRRSCRKPFRFSHGSLLSEKEVDHPATPDMFTWRSAVVQHILIHAPCVHQGVGKPWHPAKRLLVVDACGENHDIRSEPSGIDRGGAGTVSAPKRSRNTPHARLFPLSTQVPKPPPSDTAVGITGSSGARHPSGVGHVIPIRSDKTWGKGCAPVLPAS